MRKTSDKIKIAQQRSYSRKYSVNNNCIPKIVKNNFEKIVDGKPIIEWENPPKKAYSMFASTKDFKKQKQSKLTRHSIEYIDAYVKHKLAKWEKKHPRPVKLAGIQQDLFDKEFLLPWEQDRKLAEKNIYTFIIKVYGQFSLVGRFHKSNDKYEERELTTLRDTGGDVIKNGGINHCTPTTSIVKHAFDIVNKYKKIHPNLISATLKDVYNKQGRIILPGLELKSVA